MTFLADLHIHSRFSLATSKELSARNLDAWARVKGLNVIATGDCVHPAWLKELQEQLVRDEESGLYKLAVAHEKLPFLPEKNCLGSQKDPLFLLETEISSIFKKNGRVRKVHTLVYLPSLEDAKSLARRLEKLGNIASDGRPILGLDPKVLLELTLETVPNAVLVPAHIWTPWFSLFGSRSGFDSIEECFEDLTGEIFALETGLSSDPLMNRYISALDSYALISNSDAHSGSKLAREANIFAGSPSYTGIFSALKASARREADQDKLPCRFLGTMEFFPEEGKYHLDGHRACNVSLNPLETRKLNNICPVCHKALTIGVLHRVMELADRTSPATPPMEPSFRSIMPLQEMVAEILDVGPLSRKVMNEYGRMLATLGSELDILLTLPLSELASYHQDLAIACQRLRQGQVHLKAGYDGAFGKVCVFSEEEQAQRGRKGRKSLVRDNALLCQPAEPASRPAESQRSPSQDVIAWLFDFREIEEKREKAAAIKRRLYTPAQQSAIETKLTPTLVLAGPGSGKTYLLMGRIGYLLKQGHKAEDILAITFTRRAAEAMQSRLQKQLDLKTLPLCTTLHAFCYQTLVSALPNLILQSEDSALRLFLSANPDLDAKEGRKIWEKICQLREERRLALEDGSDYSRLFANYLAAQKALGPNTVCDFTQLVELALAFFQTQPRRFSAVLVDEIQDCSPLNLALIKALLPPKGTGFFGIGDPDQAIYSFRGSVENIEQALRSLWPDLNVHQLDQSFRSGQKILDAAHSLLRTPQCGELRAANDFDCQLHFCQMPDEQAESRWIARKISNLLGQSSHSLHDAQGSEADIVLAPSDIAVLVRFRQLMPAIAKSLAKAGIPTSCPAVEAFWHDSCVQQLLELLDPTSPADSLPFDKNALPRPEELLPWLERQSWSGYQPGKSKAFRKLCQLWKDCGNWNAFFEQLLWLKKEENVREKSEAVRLLTLHAAKGLEFQAVFLPALEEGILPADMSFLTTGKQNQEEWERQRREEARLCYVGITRASRLLYISRAESRMLYGQRRTLPVSSFFEGIQQYFKKSHITEKIRKVQVRESLLD